MTICTRSWCHSHFSRVCLGVLFVLFIILGVKHLHSTIQWSASVHHVELNTWWDVTSFIRSEIRLLVFVLISKNSANGKESSQFVGLYIRRTLSSFDPLHRIYATGLHMGTEEVYSKTSDGTAENSISAITRLVGFPFPHSGDRLFRWFGTEGCSSFTQR